MWDHGLNLICIENSVFYFYQPVTSSLYVSRKERKSYWLPRASPSSSFKNFHTGGTVVQSGYCFTLGPMDTNGFSTTCLWRPDTLNQMTRLVIISSPLFFSSFLRTLNFSCINKHTVKYYKIFYVTSCTYGFLKIVQWQNKAYELAHL